MAQSVEHIVHIDGVVGSSPTGTTQIKESPLVGGSFICLSRLIRTCGTLRGERTSTGRKTARCQWQKQRGFALRTLFARCQWQKQRGFALRALFARRQ